MSIVSWCTRFLWFPAVVVAGRPRPSGAEYRIQEGEEAQEEEEEEEQKIIESGWSWGLGFGFP